MKYVFVFLACLLTAMDQPVIGQPKKGPTERVLKQLDSELDQALLRGDRTTLERRLADEMTVFSSEGEVVARKPEILSQVNPPEAGVKLSITATDVQVFIFGSTAIVCSKKTSKKETAKGSSVDSYRETNTYTFRNGGWLLASTQASYGPPPYTARDVRLDITFDDALMKGSKDATVVLIEFTDYQCPLCRKFAAETFSRIETEYIKSGLVGFVVRDLPTEEIHPLAFGAAKAAHCAAVQGKFWEMNDLLLRGPLRLAPPDLLAHAEALNLDTTKFRQCLDDERTVGEIRKEMNDAQRIGVAGTPIFLIGVRKPGSRDIKVVRMIQGAYPYEVFSAALNTVITVQSH